MPIYSTQIVRLDGLMLTASVEPQQVGGLSFEVVTAL